MGLSISNSNLNSGGSSKSQTPAKKKKPPAPKGGKSSSQPQVLLYEFGKRKCNLMYYGALMLKELIS